MKNTSILKFLSGFIATTMLLTACSGGGASGSEGSNSGVTSKQGPKEKIKMSIALWDASNLEGDDWGKKIIDQFNIDVKITNLSWSNATEQLNTAAAADELPDFFSSYGLIFDWQEQGLLRSVPDDMLSNYPNVKKLFDTSIYADAIKEITGENYVIPRPESAKGLYVTTTAGLYYRKDWLKNVGIAKPPETLDEYYQMLKAFKEKDPDQNGKNDTIGLTTGGVPNFFGIQFGIDPGNWIEEDGRFIPGYYSDINIQALEFYQKLYREGLLDPEFLQMSYTEVIGKLAQGKAGSMLRNIDSQWFFRTLNSYGDANPNSNPLDDLGVLPPLKLDENSEPKASMNLSSGCTMISSKVKDDVLNRYLELNNWMMSEEGLLYRRWGDEGRDFKIENGEKVSTLPKLDGVSDEMLFQTTYPSSILWTMFDWDMDYKADIEGGDPAIPTEYKEAHMGFRTKYMDAVQDANIAATIIQTPAKLKLLIDWDAAYSQMITGSGDIKTEFAKFKKECVDKNIETAIAEETALMKEKGLDK